jgi:hypothetical protein
MKSSADKPEHACHQIRIYTVNCLVRKNLMNLKVNSADPDLTAFMCQLIWIYTVCPSIKGVYMYMYMEERVNLTLNT